MAVTGAIYPQKYANAINRHEQNKYYATSVGNKRKQTEDRKTFVVSNIVSIVSSPSNKADQNEVHAIKDFLQCSMSSSYRRKKKLLQNVDILLLKSSIHRLNGLSNHTLFKQKKLARR